MKTNCPTCGHPLKRRAKVCDYCGRDLTGATANPPTPTPGSGFPQTPTPGSGFPPTPTPGSGFPRTPTPGAAFPQGPMGQPQGPFSTPTGISPGAGRTVRNVIVFIVAAGVIAGAVLLFFFVTKQVRKGIDTVAGVDVASPLEDTSSSNKPGGAGKPGGGSGDASQEFKGARETFNAMNAHGAKCKNFDLVVETDIVSAATCFAGAEPWTIQVFLDDLSYDAVVDSYKSHDSVHVAYGGNWTVLTQSRESSKKIAKALGGRAT